MFDRETVRKNIKELGELNAEINSYRDILTQDKKIILQSGRISNLKGLYSEDGVVAVCMDTYAQGEIVPKHSHGETEILSLYYGICKIHTSDKVTAVLSAPAITLIKPNVKHSIEMIEDCGFIGVTVPNSIDYPKCEE